MKLCKDCRFCDLGRNATPPPNWPAAPALHYRCVARSGDPKYDPVAGGTFYDKTSEQCTTLRMAGGACGPDAKLFKPSKDTQG